MPRTTSALVIGVLGDDYGPNASGTLPDLTPHIATASNIVDQVVADSTLNGFTLLATTQELIERWLSAYYYTKMDPIYSSRSGASFLRKSEEHEYAAVAIDLDPSGSLNALLKRQRASGQWLGKPASQELTWDERNC